MYVVQFRNYILQAPLTMGRVAGKQDNFMYVVRGLPIWIMYIGYGYRVRYLGLQHSDAEGYRGKGGFC